MSKIRVYLSHEGSTIRRKSEHVEIGARQVGGVVGVALVSAALLNTLKPIAFREEVSTFAISSSEQPMSSAPKIAQSITVLFS